MLLTAIARSPGSADATSIVLVRLTPDLRPDPGFGDGGRVVAPAGSQALAGDVAVDERGFVAVAGGESENAHTLVVRRFTPDGRPDPGFGVDGTFGDSGLRPAAGVRVDARRRILLTGSAIRSGRDHGLTRLLASGARDPRFGSDGVAWSGASSRGAYGHATDLVVSRAAATSSRSPTRGRATGRAR